MKILSGLLVFAFSFSVSAKGSTSSHLFLRGVVPVTYKVEIRMDKDGPSPVLISNSHQLKNLPKFKVDKRANDYLVSVVHP